MRRPLAFAGLLLALSLSSFASAEEAAPSADDIKRAAAAYDRGRDSYRMESYVEAAEQFEAADGYAPSAAALRLAMLARKASDQLDRAVTHAALAVERYVDDPALQKEAQALIDEQGANLGKVNVTCDEACDLLLDNKIVHGKSSLSRVLYVLPGNHTVRAAWSERRNRSEKINLEAGGVESLTFIAPALPESPVVPEPLTGAESEPESQVQEKGGWSPVVFWTGAGVTAAGAGLSTFLGLRAINEPGVDRVRTECAGQDESCPAYQQGLQNQTMATVAIGGTVAVGVFTIITGLWLTDWSGGGEAEDAAAGSGKAYKDGGVARRAGGFTLRPTFSFGDGATVGATGTF